MIPRIHQNIRVEIDVNFGNFFINTTSQEPPLCSNTLIVHDTKISLVLERYYLSRDLWELLTPPFCISANPKLLK